MGNAESAAFPYEVAPEVLQKVRSGWELHSGWRKSDRKPVSVFIFNLPANDPGKAEEAQALAFLRRAKMLRLPNVLQFIDGLHMEAKKQVLHFSAPVDLARSIPPSFSAAGSTLFENILFYYSQLPLIY